MRRVLIISIVIIGILMVSGCVRRWKVEIVNYEAPNWTSDNKIVFMKDHYVQIFEEMPPAIAVHQAGGHEEIYICEIDGDGKNYREIAKVVDEDFEVGPNRGAVSTSSAGDWIAFAMEDWNKGEHYTEIFVMKRDGSGLRNLGEGTRPDLSPDGSKIVYQKPNQGIWIMNRDGTNDHQIVADENAHDPAWSSDGKRITYEVINLIIVDTLGNVLQIINESIDYPDWGPSDSNAIAGSEMRNYKGKIIYLGTEIVDTLKITSGYGLKWSPDGSKFIAYDGKWYITNREGTNKWYLKDKIK